MEYNPITVTDLNKYIKNKIDGDEMLNNVLVKGEISNFKNHYTGHMYFKRWKFINKMCNVQKLHYTFIFYA